MTATRNVLLGIYVVLALSALCWPGYALFGNTIEPRVLGVPFSLAWVVGWVLLTFFVLLAYHATAPPEPLDVDSVEGGTGSRTDGGHEHPRGGADVPGAGAS